MSVIFGFVYILLMLYFLALMIRMVFDWIQGLAREWRPRGAALVTASAVYAVTDPPLRKLRSWIPTVRIGNVGLDIGFIVLVFVLIIAMSITLNLSV